MRAAPVQPISERGRLALAVAAAPRDAAARKALAAALAKAGEHRAALDQYRAVLELRPNDPDAAADAGLMARQCGREEEVLALVRTAAAAHPRHARLWQVLGLLHRSLDELDDAIKALDRAAGLAPADGLIAHGRARANLESGRPAVALFETAARLAPADGGVLLGLAAARLAEGRGEAAIAGLEAVLRRSPGWAEGQATLARLRWEMGDHDGYTATLEEALAASPRDLGLWRELLIALIHAGRHEQAMAAIERGRAAAGPSPVFDANEAACRAELGDSERADALFERLARLNDPMVAIRHIRHLLRTGRPGEAERIALPMTASVAGNEVWPYLSLAWRLTGDPRWQWLEGDERLVGIYDLGGAIPSLDALADCLRALHVTHHQPLEQSLRGGTQTDGYLFARTEPEIRALRQAIVEAVEAHIAQLPPPDPAHPQLSPPRDRAVRFAGAWSVRLTDEGHHINHVHPAGWFSSALYVTVPDAGESGGGEAGWLVLGEPHAELELDLAPFRKVEPKPGRLALFPSTMWHGTRPFAKGERMTVAFDVARPVS